MDKSCISNQIQKLDQQLDELEKAQMFVKKTIPLYDEPNDGFTTPKSKKSQLSNYGSEYPTTPSGEFSSGFQQSLFNAPSKELEFPEYTYESPKYTTSLKFKFMNNTYTYFDEEEIEQQNKLKKLKEEEEKPKSYHHHKPYQTYMSKKQPDQNDLRVILGLPIFEKED